MINVQQITSMLRRLQPDTALQEYAKANKDNPYIMALALSESNRRKQMREGAQANAPEQPKVVDQAIQSMAAPMPEDIGIAQLPAGDMEFADGGIVAFDEGGPVERYQDRGLVRPGPGVFAEDPRLAREAIKRARLYRDFSRLGVSPSVVSAGFEAARAAGPAAALATVPAGLAYGLTSAMQEMRDQGYTADPLGEFSSGAMTPAQAAFDEDRRRRAISAMSREERLRKFGTADVNLAMAGGAFSPAGKEAAQRAQSAAPAAAAPLASPDADFPSAARTRAAPVAGTGARPPAGARPAAPAAPAAPATLAAAAPVAPTAGLPSLDVREMFKRELEAAAKQPVPQEEELKALGRERVKAKEEEAAGVEAIQKRFDDIFKGRRERLDTREAELGKMEDQGIGLALLQAGATMMSTPGGLGVALGESIKVGTKQYASGLERLRSAQEKLSDARDRLEEAEAQRGELSARELLKVRSDVKNAGISAREDMIKFYMERDKVNRETALKMVDNDIKVGVAQLDIQNRRDIAQYEAQTRRDISQFEAQNRRDIAGMEIAGRERAANAPSGQERIALALGGGNLERGLTRMAEIQAGKFDPKKAYTEYLVAAQKTPGADLMSYSQFIGQFAIPTAPGNNPAAAPGTVRERP